MLKARKTIVERLMRLVHCLVPKRSYAVLWGWPDGEDSIIALEQALQKTQIQTVVMLMSNPTAALSWKIGPKTRRVKKNSVSGVMWFCFARYVFFTHPCFTRKFPKSVISINVWHGMPIKRIGKLLDGDVGIASRHALASSPFWAEIMQRAMAPSCGVLPIGLPRNDRLFSDRMRVFEKLGLPAERRLVVWLPTYRKSVRGLLRTDGIASDNVFEMPDVNPDALNAFLKSHDATLLVKPHPMAAFDASVTWSNLLIVDDAWLHERLLSLYELLGASDVLISDISSVVIDYLLLDRPIIHAFSDLTEYQSSRGFTVEPISEYFAGPVVTNVEELVNTLGCILSGKDLDADKRRKLLELSHAHRGEGATRRLLEEVVR